MNTLPSPAGFFRRFTAGIIDFIVAALMIFGIGWLCSLSKSIALLLIVPLSLAPFAYQVYFHAQAGQTLGKRLLKIRVIDVAGGPIDWKQSIRRSSVDGIAQISWGIGLLIAVIASSTSIYASQGWGQLHDALKPHLPNYVNPLLTLSSILGWSEFVTMLLNRRRRALHDFLGATQVVKTN